MSRLGLPLSSMQQAIIKHGACQRVAHEPCMSHLLLAEQRPAAGASPPGEQQPLKTGTSVSMEGDSNPGLVSHPIDCTARATEDDVQLLQSSGVAGLSGQGFGGPQTPKDVRGKIDKYERLSESPVKGRRG